MVDRRFIEKQLTQTQFIEKRNSIMAPPDRGNRSGSFMSRRTNMQQTSYIGSRGTAAGLESSNILDTKYSMNRQRGQLKSEGGGFMRQQIMNSRSVQNPRRKVQTAATEVETVDINRMTAQYQHLLNYKPKLGVTESIMHQNVQVAQTYNTVHNSRSKINRNSKKLLENDAHDLNQQNSKLKKTICAQLKRLVKSGDNSHYLLEERRPQVFEIIEGIGVLCRIRLKEKSPPCVITFTKEKGAQPQRFKCYYSEYLREPDEMNNHGIESDPTKIVIAGVREGRSGVKRTQVFNKDWLYLHLQSEHGCRVTVSVSFKTELAPLRANAKGDPNASVKGEKGANGSPRAGAKAAAAAAAKPTESEEQDFSQWDLGKGKIQEKRDLLSGWLTKLMDRNNKKMKKMHDRYCQQIKRKRNRGIQQEVNVAAVNTNESLVYNDRSQSEFENHNNMLTVMPLDGAPDQEQESHRQTAIVFNNDFISKNKYMLAFYREHDQEKRNLFSKLRDECSMRARCNRDMVGEEKRTKVMNFMGRWDEYRVRREIVLRALMQVQKKQSACRFWQVTHALMGRLQYLSATMEQQRELKLKQAKELARQQLLIKQQEEANRESQSGVSDFEQEPEDTQQMPIAPSIEAPSELLNQQQLEPQQTGREMSATEIDSDQE